MLTENNIIAHQISVTQGDGGIDIQATYKRHLILIQCKNTKDGINLGMVQKMESACSRFTNFIGVLVYNQDNLSGNPITRQAKHWINASNFNIKYCNNYQLVELIKDNIDDLESENVVLDNFSSERMEISGIVFTNVKAKKVFIKRFKPY